jgi:hypothetical protein
MYINATLKELTDTSAFSSLSEKEKRHIIKLGQACGSIRLMVDAMKSENIFDPAHMRRANEIKAEWDRGVIF